MAVAGEPLQGRHGVLLYSLQGSKGTPVTPATAIGLAPLRGRSKSGARLLFGIGSANPLFCKPGGASVDFNPTGVLMQNNDFLTDCCDRDAYGVLPWFTLGIGYKDDAASPARWAWQIQDCKVHQLDLSLEAGDGGGILNLGFSGVGGLITDLTTLDPANASQAPLAEYEGVLTRGGSAHEARSFKMAINHNVKVYWVLHGAAPGTFKRGWTYQTEGRQEVTGEVVRYAKSGINMQADTLTGSSLVLTLTDIGGSGNVVAMTAGGAVYGEEEIGADPEGELLFTCPFQATSLTLA